MPSLGLVITDPARFTAADTMLDVHPLLEALQAHGANVRAVDWADPAVDWSGFDLVVLRSPWDYSVRPAEFDAWLDRAGAATRILNDPELVRWNMDKRYLAELERAGIPGIPTTLHEDESSLAAALSAASAGAHDGHVVLKPTVGAGARLTGLLHPGDPAALALGLGPVESRLHGVVTRLAEPAVRGLPRIHAEPDRGEPGPAERTPDGGQIRRGRLDALHQGAGRLGAELQLPARLEGQRGAQGQLAEGRDRVVQPLLGHRRGVLA